LAAKSRKIGSRYGRALLKAIAVGDLKSDAVSLTQAYEIISGLNEAINSNFEFQSLLHNPIIDPTKRVQVITSVLTELKASEKVIKFMQIVLTNHRITALPDIVSSFDALVKEYLNVVNVKVESARVLAEDEKKNIAEQLKSQIKQELSLSWIVNADLIGGVIIEYLGKKIDGSVRGKISEMGKNLAL
jgi:F-type H+-transporting ATPase subunit delta